MVINTGSEGYWNWTSSAVSISPCKRDKRWTRTAYQRLTKSREGHWQHCAAPRLQGAEARGGCTTGGHGRHFISILRPAGPNRCSCCRASWQRDAACMALVTLKFRWHARALMARQTLHATKHACVLAIIRGCSRACKILRQLHGLVSSLRVWHSLTVCEAYRPAFSLLLGCVIAATSKEGRFGGAQSISIAWRSKSHSMDDEALPKVLDPNAHRASVCGRYTRRPGMRTCPFPFRDSCVQSKIRSRMIGQPAQSAFAGSRHASN